jgi:hypothetical protein
MATPNLITTGEQSVTAVGAVTGSLSTNGLPKAGWLKARIRGLLPGQSIQMIVQDTANATPFSDAIAVWEIDTAQGAQVATVPENEMNFAIELFRLPDMRFGGANNALRGNVTGMTAGAAPLVTIWLEQ